MDLDGLYFSHNHHLLPPLLHYPHPHPHPRPRPRPRPRQHKVLLPRPPRE